MPDAAELAAWATMSVWEQLDITVQRHPIVIDRPCGSHHPDFPELVHPVDYGFIDGTVGGDGEGIDIWVADPDSRRVTALFITHDPLKRNAEIKIVLGGGEGDLAAISAFYEPLALSHLLIRRG
ncbi:MAG: hypothetical protein Q4D89_01865 [Arachnia propionica]|uniref:hypothetical protein n=1 Tax=Arachnia propionica TaxID=1750 RepID=UPI00270F522F|nr:hypothetical protein [Arachnia propionica]